MKRVRLGILFLAALPVMAPLALAQNATPAPAAKPVAAVQAADPAAKVPAPILAAFRKSYPNATIKNASKETEDGRTVWEVESVDHNLGRDLVYKPDGTVVEVEEEVAMAAVPPAVANGLKAKYPKAEVTKAEKRTAGQAVTYEFALKGAAVTSVEITPDGRIVPASKEKDEKDEKEDAPKKK
jgi:hypothetical protein